MSTLIAKSGPQIFSVYQIVIDNHLSDLINKEGWDCHVKALAYKEAMFGNVVIGMKHDCYTKVAEIVADDQDHVFEVGNIGPEDRITRFEKMTSISVGNIIEDENGSRFAVADVGFTPLAPSLQQKDMA